MDRFKLQCHHRAHGCDQYRLVTVHRDKSKFTARCYASAVLAILAQNIGFSGSANLTQAPKFSHTTPILRSLHWLKITERIEYKLLSQAGVLLKRQNVGSHKQHHTIPQGL